MKAASGLQAEIQNNNHRQLHFCRCFKEKPSCPVALQVQVEWPRALFKWLLSSFITCPPAGTRPHFDRFWNIKEKRWSVDESQLKSTFSFWTFKKPVLYKWQWLYDHSAGWLLPSALFGPHRVCVCVSPWIQMCSGIHSCASALSYRCSRDHVPTASVWTCSIMTAWIHVKINPVCSFHARLLYFTLLDCWAVPRLRRSRLR